STFPQAIATTQSLRSLQRFRELLKQSWRGQSVSATLLLRIVRSAAVALVATVAAAQVAAQAPADPRVLAERSSETRREYEQLKRQISLSDEKLKALELEVAGLRKDNATLTATLIQVAK